MANPISKSTVKSLNKRSQKLGFLRDLHRGFSARLSRFVLGFDIMVLT
jgi:hypothetical protein